MVHLDGVNWGRVWPRLALLSYSTCSSATWSATLQPRGQPRSGSWAEVCMAHGLVFKPLPPSHCSSRIGNTVPYYVISLFNFLCCFPLGFYERESVLEDLHWFCSLLVWALRLSPYHPLLSNKSVDCAMPFTASQLLYPPICQFDYLASYQQHGAHTNANGGVVRWAEAIPGGGPSSTHTPTLSLEREGFLQGQATSGYRSSIKVSYALYIESAQCMVQCIWPAQCNWLCDPPQIKFS